MRQPEQNTIALVTLVIATGLMIYLFAASRNDPSLRIAALVAGTGLVASLGSIASTILTGKDVTQVHKDLPPGSTQVTQIPPTGASVHVDPIPNQEKK